MLASLPYDLLNRVMIFVEPKEIKVLYECSKDLIKEMMEETKFIVECKVIISDEQVEWFESNNIKVNLLEEYKVDNRGNQYWYKNGRKHRDDDLPAEISVGNQYWFKNGKLYRDNDLPTAIHLNGDRFWHKNNNLHRDNDLPAVILSNGTQYWFKNGVKYRQILVLICDSSL